VTRLFPRHDVTQIQDGSLLEQANPPEGQVYAACFDGVTVLCTTEVGIDYPSRLDQRFLDVAEGRTVYLHAMHSVVDWFAYAQWTNGTLVRALSLSPDSGILEDIGPRLPFEEPYWAGRHPALDDSEDQTAYPFPFHPLELGEAALGALFGYHLEGPIDGSLIEPETIPLARYKRSRSRWKFW